ncbi:hypothetical protein CY34DRAFT_151112 [Suillus luteus UH-Slu-Lm8-n1]|uniref:Uncharacterized protein n=1 Tax=Suillus luteus UH-Slu-Lm8-n1 TaxID=930992 RepID=A0A0D0BDX3_9AGAM|nr:hypothetical protein CY34DRAFT_151112 [Suillus luteus UH-Slu-Lm8-n1]
MTCLLAGLEVSIPRRNGRTGPGCTGCLSWYIPSSCSLHILYSICCAGERWNPLMVPIPFLRLLWTLVPNLSFCGETLIRTYMVPSCASKLVNPQLML